MMTTRLKVVFSPKTLSMFMLLFALCEATGPEDSEAVQGGGRHCGQQTFGGNSPNPEKFALSTCQERVTTCYVKCKTGFHVNEKNTQTITCQDGSWTEPVKCKPMKCSEPSADHIQGSDCTSSELEYRIRTECTIECAAGYTAQSNGKVTCTAQEGSPSAYWDPQLTKICVEIDCGPPPVLLNGKSPSCSGRKFINPQWSYPVDASCTYTCVKGYRISGDGSATCSQEGRWTDNLPTCSEIRCSSGPALSHQLTIVSCKKDNRFVTATSNYPYGTICEVSCGAGYFLSGSKKATCSDQDDDGTGVFEWSSSPPVCREISCSSGPTLGDQLNLGMCRKGTRVVTLPYPYGTICDVECQAGFFLSGSKKATCRGANRNGHGAFEWASSSAPTCREVQCARPSYNNKIEQLLCGADTSYWKPLGSSCIYTCNAGYALSGNSKITTCVDNDHNDDRGSWTAKPTCEDVDECNTSHRCSPNANCKNTKGSYTCTCRTGYSGNGYTCKRLTCNVTDVANRQSNCSRTVEYGTRCKFSCSDGYDLSSSGTTTCLGTMIRRWNLPVPSCNEITCRSPPAVINGQTPYCTPRKNWKTGQYQFGTVCSYVCQTGFNLAGGINRMSCVDDGSDTNHLGTWTQTPVCTKNPCDPNPCNPGECSVLNGEASCQCTANTFGPHCKNDRVEFKFDKSRYYVNHGRSISIVGTLSIFDVGKAEFVLSINGQEKKFEIPDGTKKKTLYHEEKTVVKSMYVSGRAVLQGQTATTKYDCTKIVVPNERKSVNASEDVCDSGQLLLKWEPVNIALGHTVHISQGRSVTVDAKTYDIDPGIASYTASGLKPKTSYDISVTPHLMGCSNITQVLDSYTTTGLTSLGVPKPPERVQLKQESNRCTVSWRSSGRPQDMDGYQLRIEEIERHLMRSGGEPHLKTRNNSAASVVINHRFVMNPNTVYKVYIGVVPLPSCFGRIKTKWSTNQTGSCITGPASPNKVDPPEIDNSKGSSFTLKNVNERNGLVSCYFVIVRKANGSSSNTTTPVANITQLKQANDTVLDGEPFIALAYKRFDEPRDVKLGDDTTTCCDMSGNGTCSKTDNKRRRRKRDTGSSTVVKARNHPLEPGSSYEVYVLVSTPTDDDSDPVLKASPVSTFVQKEEEHVPESQVGMLVAVVLVCLFLLIIIIVGVLLYRRRMQKKRLESMPERMPMRGGNPANQADDIIIVAGGQRQKPEDIVDRALASCTFLLADLSEVMNEKRANEDMIFLDEFKTMIPNAIKECRPTAEIAKLPANLVKNRYRNIVPHDNARVELKKLPRDEFSDYINATHIDGYNAPRKFIAAQGPKPETVKDFWRMVWEHQCSVIAVLTRLTEKKKVKCAQYWSEDEDQVALYDTITVNLVETTSYGDFVRRKFEVTRDKEVREVLQYQFVAWPDHGTPDTTSSLLRFHQTVMYSQPPGAGPVVVHCSAGVGRTGTFVALDILREKIARQERINVAQIVGRMRIRRPEMVQTLDQYIFIHKLVLELYHFGETGIDVSDFSRVYNELRQLNNGRSGIEQEFAMLDYFAPLDTIQDSSSKLENKKLSRDPSILPYDRNAVFVQMQPTDKNVPYYNGTSIATYDSGSRFIAAQTPTSASVDLFWRAVVNNNVDIIVMLCEKAEPANFSFWPEKSDEGKYGSITVRNLEENADMGFVERTFSVTSRDKKMTVCQICYDQWPDDATPSSSGLILEIIAKVEKHYQTLAESKKKTTLVHCSDGSGRTGAFCAISNLIDRLKNENHIDLFRTVKDLRDQRIMMVRTLAQYEFCYQAVSEFLESFDLYGNFR